MRYPNWTARLRVELMASYGRPFRYGETDCVQLAARFVEAISDRRATLERYAGRREAIAYLRREGGIEAAVTKRLGPPVPAQQARLGDVVLVKNFGRRFLGIHVGHDVVAQGRHSVIFLPAADAVLAWRVT